MRLTAKADKEYFKNLTHNHLQSNKWEDAALIIHKFQFHTEFDCLPIFNKLTEQKKI